MNQWRTRTEREDAERAQRLAMIMALKERDKQKPLRKTHLDGEISKRRDKS